MSLRRQTNGMGFMRNALLAFLVLLGLLVSGCSGNRAHNDLPHRQQGPARSAVPPDAMTNLSHAASSLVAWTVCFDVTLDSAAAPFHIVGTAMARPDVWTNASWIVLLPGASSLRSGFDIGFDPAAVARGETFQRSLALAGHVALSID